MTSATDPGRWSRRTVLLGGVAVLGAGVAGMAGCGTPNGPSSSRTTPGTSTSSAPGQSTGATDQPSPAEPSVSVFPGSVEGATLEDALATHAATVLTVGKSRLDKNGRALVTAIRDQHRAHAAALRTSDPTDPATAAQATAPHPTTPSPGASAQPGFTRAVGQLLAAESKAAATHRSSALQTTDLASLLWGSLATSAAAIAGILEAADLAGDEPDPEAATVAAVKARAPMPLLSIVQAEQQLVTQLHAVVYGYQLALGRLSGSSRDTAAAELRRHRILRDQLTARLLNRKADVPVAAPAYVPSTNPRNARTAGKLIRQMETALLPFCGLWLAATDSAGERAQALGQIGHTAGVSRQWGGTLTAWPGWTLA